MKKKKKKKKKKENRIKSIFARGILGENIET